MFSIVQMDELQGIIKGLVDIALGQIKTQKKLSENTSHQLATLRDTVADLSSQVSSKVFTGVALRLPPITLPTYTGPQWRGGSEAAGEAA